MNLLLDTHVFLWSLFTPDKLSETVIHEIKSPNNDVAVSVVTFWEISLKYALGKLELTGVKPEDLPDFADQMSLEILPITAAEASTFYKLPRLTHKDPFDRIIIWQAIQRKMILVTKDRGFKEYHKLGLRTFW
ncbi:type II toxin-antitoxin system VapC family toxin [Desulfobacula sp.]|uniref:type II toxin-antitoxin system VapC family toxin n=1 Tax=Desulfobacula sp. TaxID=2593537 RepID=UPI0025B8DE22|nr:type II toxin-antitoxin system VapC family toxin [Desulfobacula sp.]MBC2705974.1 type II toxin-antitoxin system VapC family toxin [Desulfobacula sp.]